jgi:hypothetical protein
MVADGPTSPAPDENTDWFRFGGEGRVSPRDCIAAARDDLNRAYGRTDRRVIEADLLSALDWMRRGLEQMAESDPRPFPCSCAYGADDTLVPKHEQTYVEDCAMHNEQRRREAAQQIAYIAWRFRNPLASEFGPSSDAGHRAMVDGAYKYIRRPVAPPTDTHSTSGGGSGE